MNNTWTNKSTATKHPSGAVTSAMQSEQVKKWKARNACAKAKKTQTYRRKIVPKPRPIFSITRELKSVAGKQIMTVSRPGYPLVTVPQSNVDAWIQKAKEHTIKTIVCFLDQSQLDHYSQDLIECYRNAGFAVYSYPVPDFNHPPIPVDVLEILAKDVRTMAEPIAIHCSAGEDRSGAAVSYLSNPDEYLENYSGPSWMHYDIGSYDEWKITSDQDGNAIEQLTDKQRITQLESEIRVMDDDLLEVESHVRNLTTRVAGLTAMITQGLSKPKIVTEKEETI